MSSLHVDLAEKMRQLPGWGADQTVTVWSRARCRCEYCDNPLIEDFGTYQWGREYDHILPQKYYKGVVTEGGSRKNTWLQNTGGNYRNLALSCCFCNAVKGDRDFGHKIDLNHDVTDITEVQRATLVSEIRNAIKDESTRQRQEARDDSKRISKLMAEWRSVAESECSRPK